MDRSIDHHHHQHRQGSQSTDSRMAPTQTMPESPSGALERLSAEWGRRRMLLEWNGWTLARQAGQRQLTLLCIPAGDWRVTLLAVKGVKAAFDSVELTLEGKTSGFDLAEGDGKSGDEVVRAFTDAAAQAVTRTQCGRSSSYSFYLTKQNQNKKGAARGQDLLPVRARDGAHDAARHRAEAGLHRGGHGLAPARQGGGHRGRECRGMESSID